MLRFKNSVLAAVGSSLVTAGAIKSSASDLIMGILVLLMALLPWERWSAPTNLDESF